MKYNYRLMSASALLIITCLSCSKQKFTGNDDLTGSWNWVRTDGGIANNIHDTPASTGKSIELKFSTDGKYVIYQNDAIISEGSFSVEKRDCIHDHGNKRMINFSDPARQDMMVENLTSLRLELSDENYDGVNSVYARK
jgi:hypothetical protein